jgi:Mn2+/Fe2+ NRAMP family transporter
VLGLSTLTAVVLAFGHASPGVVEAPSPFTLAALPFLLALMGWMPIPIDVAVWHSLWTIERREQTYHRPSVRAAVGDFNIGYGIAFLMALAFLALGVLLMHGTGERFAAASVPFAEQLVSLYTRTLGSAAAPVITLAALTAMFSTTLAVTDAYPRVVEGTWRAVRRPREKQVTESRRRVYLGALLTVPLGALVVLWAFAEQMTLLIDVATTLAFFSAPVLGWMNYRLVTSPHMPEAAQPSRALRLLSWAGLAFLGGFGLAFLVVFLG